VDIPVSLRDDICGDWKSHLLRSPMTNQPKPILANALIALREAPDWLGVLAHDEFALVPMAMRPPPWQQRLDISWTPQPWADGDDARATEWLHHQGIVVSLTVTQTAILAVAGENPFHPIKDYLNALRWDGTPRIEAFVTRYLGADDTAYHRAIGRCMLIAAVARIMRPGSKVDHVPVLEGEQGILKSTAIEKMFAPWFSDDLAELGTKDAAMQIRVAWGIEIAELASMTRSEIEKIKGFITRKVDRFRPPYGRHVICVPRQSVLIGSTNTEAYLKDDTGARRFWPIKCGDINTAGIDRDKDQLWAEALALFSRGVPWWLNGDDTFLAQVEQDDRHVVDPWQESINRYLEGKDRTSITEILECVIDKPKERWTQLDQSRVGACLKGAGFVRKRGQRPARQWYYARGVPVDTGTDDEDWDR